MTTPRDLNPKPPSPLSPAGHLPQHHVLQVPSLHGLHHKVHGPPDRIQGQQVIRAYADDAHDVPAERQKSCADRGEGTAEEGECKNNSRSPHSFFISHSCLSFLIKLASMRKSFRSSVPWSTSGFSLLTATMEQTPPPRGAMLLVGTHAVSTCSQAQRQDDITFRERSLVSVGRGLRGKKPSVSRRG